MTNRDYINLNKSINTNKTVTKLQKGFIGQRNVQILTKLTPKYEHT